MTLLSPLLTGYTGGELEAQSAYEEALNAVFVKQLTWRHMQPHRSRRDGKTKWSMIEMWPMNVSGVTYTAFWHLLSGICHISQGKSVVGMNSCKMRRVPCNCSIQNTSPTISPPSPTRTTPSYSACCLCAASRSAYVQLATRLLDSQLTCSQLV